MRGSKEDFEDMRMAETVPDFVSFRPTKANITATGEQLLHLIETGAESPLKIAQIAKFFSEVFERIKEPLRNHVLDAMKGSKELSETGATFEQAEFGVSYNFEVCGDTDWEHWDSAERGAKASRQEREKFLKALKAPIEIVDSVTGEIVKIFPPHRKSTTSYKITFSK